MDETERDCLMRDMMKYNEFHKGGQKEDRTTSEIVEIATSLEDGAIISCVTWLWPNMRLSITLDNRPYDLVKDVMLAVRNRDHYEFHFQPYDIGGLTRIKGGPARNSKDMNIVDIVESFGLDDEKIINPEPPSPGIWTGWFLISYRGPRTDR
jgi:hypothetical protein